MTLINRSNRWLIIIASVLLFGSAFSIPLNAKAQGAHHDEQLVCLDPGHQSKGNNALEPVAPDSKEMKAKVSSGTRGVKTKKPEYVLTLEASLMLKQKLETLGYKVAMTRESHNVDISNIERAQMCNEVHADLAVRIHADGDSSSKTRGISLLYPAKNSGTEAIFSQSRAAAEIILQEAVAATGAVSRGTVARSDLTGFNWTTVPSVLIEMGFMTNPEEDESLSDTEYMNQLTEGIAAGVNEALAAQVAEEPETAAASRVYVTTTTQLYELSNGKMIRTKSALSPQTVQVTATKGGWGKVSTWIGERWISLDQALSPVQSVDKMVDVKETASIYQSPLDTEPAGQLSPQELHVSEQWNGWYLVDTWLGKMWLLYKE